MPQDQSNPMYVILEFDKSNFDFLYIVNFTIEILLFI